MEEEQPDFDAYRQHIQSSLSGELGDDAQEEMIVALFEGQLKHQIGMMTVWAGNGVGSLGKMGNTLIWN